MEPQQLSEFVNATSEFLRQQDIPFAVDQIERLALSSGLLSMRLEGLAHGGQPAPEPY